MGVWIETLKNGEQADEDQVTPFVGVWIETLSPDLRQKLDSRHTLRGCVD